MEFENYLNCLILMNILFYTDYIIADLLFDRQIRKTFLVTTVWMKMVSRYMYRISWVYPDTYCKVSNKYCFTPIHMWKKKMITGFQYRDVSSFINVQLSAIKSHVVD